MELVFLVIIVIAPIVAVFKLIRFLFRYPERKRVRDAAFEFAQAARNSRLPSDEVLALLANRDEQFDEYYGGWLRDYCPGRFGFCVTYREAVQEVLEEEKRKKEEQKIKKAQREAVRKYKQLVRQFLVLESECTPFWDLATRLTAALKASSEFLSFREVVEKDLLHILKLISVANGSVTKPLGQLYQAISSGWGERQQSIQSCKSEIARFRRAAICLPATVELMHHCDLVFNTQLTSSVAEAHKSFVIAARECCEPSHAVEAVQLEYFRLLEPYLAGCEGGQRTPARDTTGSCQECNEAYQLLELPFGAGKDAVSDAKREMAKNFHPDAFGNRRGVRVAEEQLKRVNAACDHLLECRLSSEQPVG
jgi:hypothetical protein